MDRISGLAKINVELVQDPGPTMLGAKVVLTIITGLKRRCNC
jgi:hypothetical protein